MLTQKRLKELLDYNPNTGQFTWTNPPSFRMKSGDKAGTKMTAGYTKICVDSTEYYTHRLAWLYVFGCFPKQQIDHINHVRDDNRLSNLRLADDKTNSKNMSKPRNNTSGCMGVGWDTYTDKWLAYIGIDGKHINLGRFDNIDDAIKVRKQAEIDYGFHPNHGS